jgi:hypothetical protein
MSSITPNMNMIIPDPLVTSGPTYASQIDTAFNVVDAHNHTAGNGVPVPTAGLNINADLTFAGYRATNVLATSYNSLSSSPTLVNSSYVKNGELAFKDKNGTEVILTNNGSVAGVSGSISGLVSPATATFSAISGIFTFSNDTNKAGKIAGSDYIMYKFNDTTGSFLTLKWAPSSPISYTIQYPDSAPPSADSVAKTATDGTQTFNAFGIVPIGGVIAISDNISGSFPVPTTGTSSRGWQLCDGATVEAGAVLSGATPQLTDARFLMGSTTAGVTGGSNTPVFTGTQNLPHSHIMAHTHLWGYGTGIFQSRIGTDRNSTTMTGTTTVFGAATVQSGAGATVMVATAANNVYTTGVLDTGNGSSGGTAATEIGTPIVNFSGAVLNSGDLRPKYVSCKYLIRIK